MWWSRRNRLKDLEDAHDALVRATRVDRERLDDLEGRVRKLAFRLGKLGPAPVAVPTDIDEDGQESIAPGASTPGVSPDPISARLLRQRARRGPPPNGEQ